MRTPYKSKSGKPSGVTAYEAGEDYIKVWFRDDDFYIYSENLNNKETIDHMKELAVQQEGLSSFISRNRDWLQYEHLF